MVVAHSDNGVNTTQLSLDIVEFVSEEGGVRLRDVHEEFAVAKSTAHKHLSTLRANGYVTKRGETYRVGLKYLNLGERARRRWPGYQHIEEAIGTLTERTEEECDFVAPDRGRVITIAESYHKWAKYDDTSATEASKAYRANTGSYYRLHATASGLAVLATYSRSEVADVLDRWGLPARTDYTITTEEELFDELESIRQRGYAVDNQGYTEGMRSIGKAVHGPSGRVIGALSVSGPTYRVDGMVLKQEIPNALTDVVMDLEERLSSTA